MNKVLLVGRMTRDPETKTSASGIKYAKFSVVVDRPYGEDQADFIPVVAWRSQADFIDKYASKGARISVEGRFTSSRVEATGDQPAKIFYEVAADRVELLETKAESELRRGGSVPQHQSISEPTPAVEQKQETKKEETPKDVPWELDL